MKVKLNIFLLTVAVVLMMAVSVYAHPGDSHYRETGGNISLENPMTVTAVEKVTEKTVVENLPTSETTATKDSVVSKWLEARATEEAGAGKSSVEAAMFPIDEGEETMGGGWCNHCGCWMRHGCDPNGNCNLGHISVCGNSGSGCWLHNGTSCASTG